MDKNNKKKPQDKHAQAQKNQQKSKQLEQIKNQPLARDDDLVPISDQESGQEGDFEEELTSNLYIPNSVRAQYNNQSTKMSQISILNNQQISLSNKKSDLNKGRSTISALSQNELDQELSNEKLIQQEMIHQKIIEPQAANENVNATDIYHEDPLDDYGLESMQDQNIQITSHRQPAKTQKKGTHKSQYLIKNRSAVNDNDIDKVQIEDLPFGSNNGSNQIEEHIQIMDHINKSVHNTQEHNDTCFEIEDANSLISNNTTDVRKEQQEDQSQSYKVHSNNSPDDDLSISTPGKKAPQRLKWILVREGNENQNQISARNGGLRGFLKNLSDPSNDEANGQGGNRNNQSIQTPQIKNHTATLFNKKLYIFGGYDGKKNHCNLRVFDTERDCWVRQVNPGGIPPQGRNGHTATLVRNKLYIIGGWLGQGPFAADDMHILDLQKFEWLTYNYTGVPPGPCNMHTADCYEDKIYVFRGGDGRDYLNDLHELNTQSLHWRSVQDIKGRRPPPRANHSSSIIKDKLYIFGGWDGSKRLNDLFVFQISTFTWSQVEVVGESPAPRAGMELCNVNDKLYLFGGSGPHAYCFNDLYTFDPKSSSWEHCNNILDAENNPNPNARAGHSMTLVDCKLYIIGGSYGQDYLKDVYILDTDPCPDFTSSVPECNNTQQKNRLWIGIHGMLNKSEFSDVTFMVEGKPFYGHKIIISQLSEKFKAMFSANQNVPGMTAGGFIESKQNSITINNISYPIFEQIMSYLYSGDLNLSQFIEDQIKMKIAKSKKLPEDGISSSNNTTNNNQTHLNMAVDLLIDFLRVSDEYLLEELKNNCQAELIKLIDEYTYHTISEMGELYNADRIVDYCQWFKRRKLSMLYGYGGHHQSTITTTTDALDLNQINSSSIDNNQMQIARNEKIIKVASKPPSPPLSDTSCIASESATGSNAVRNSLTSIIPQKSKH